MIQELQSTEEHMKSVLYTVTKVRPSFGGTTITNRVSWHTSGLLDSSLHTLQSPDSRERWLWDGVVAIRRLETPDHGVSSLK